MLDRATFRSFRALRTVDVEFARLTVFVGPNGSGKSSVLDGLRILSRVGDEMLASLFGIGEAFGRDTTKADEASPRTIAAVGAGSDGAWSIDLTLRGFVALEGDPKKGPRPSVACVRFKRGETEKTHWIDALNDEPSWELLLQREIGQTRLLRFDPQQLAATSYFETRAPHIHSSGAGLAARIADLKLRDYEGFRALVRSFCAVVPHVRDVHPEHDEVHQRYEEQVRVGDVITTVQRTRTVPGYRLWFETAGGRIDATMVGEGTVLALGILTAIIADGDTRLLLIDDLDRALHPQAQIQLLKILRTLMDQRKELQIIATAHSPFVLDELNYDEVRVAVLDTSGHTKIGKLTDYQVPEMARWRESMLPGEFWTMVGEKWLAAMPEPG